MDSRSQTHSLIPVPSQALFQAFAEPKGKVFLLYGDPLIFRLSLLMAGSALSRDTVIALVDGCNRFDIHTLIRFARERRLSPDALLQRIFISRGFTCYQMEAAVTRKLPEFFQRRNARIGMIFGLLDTMYDEQAPFREVQPMLTRMISALRTVKAGGGSILISCRDVKVLPLERNSLLRQLKTGMDSVYHARPDNVNAIHLFLEQKTTTLST